MLAVTPIQTFPRMRVKGSRSSPPLAGESESGGEEVPP
jgi:hypothetical protein